MPLVTPFRTSFGTQSSRDILLLRVVTDEAEGWGECVAMSDPLYSSEYVDAAADVLRRFLVPALAAAGPIDAAWGRPRAGTLQGSPDGQGRPGDGVSSTPSCAPRAARSAQELGAVRERVPCGVSVGIMDSIPALLDAVGGYLAEGYVRIKLKIEPGWDIEPVRAVRERFGDEMLLQVDANTAYTLADGPHLARLDPFDLLLIEQPLDEEDMLGHADLARLIRTPVCLDESIVSAQSAAAAIRLGACQIVNIKPGRVGGYLEARRIHDLCVANGVPVWCGGMLETGIGRAANVALAALPGFTLPGDVSGSGRFYRTDITATVRARRRPPRRPDRAGAWRLAAARGARRGHHRNGVARGLTGVRPSGRSMPAYLRSQSRDQGLQGERPGGLGVRHPCDTTDLRERLGREIVEGGLRGPPTGGHPTLECDRECCQRGRLHRAVGVFGTEPRPGKRLEGHLEGRRRARPLDRATLECGERAGVCRRDRADRGEEAADPFLPGDRGCRQLGLVDQALDDPVRDRVAGRTWLYNDVTCTPSSAAIRRRVTAPNPSRSAMVTAAAMMRSRVSGGTAQCYRLLTPKPTV